jgi:hypothetical protein
MPLSDIRGFNHIAGFHGAPSWYCWHHQASRRTQLQARLFLSCHRAYLYWLEQSLQDRAPGVAVPWWNWDRDRRCAAGRGCHGRAKHPDVCRLEPSYRLMCGASTKCQVGAWNTGEAKRCETTRGTDGCG